MRECRVGMHVFIELGVKVGSRLCSYSSAGRQPRGIASFVRHRTSAPVVASHCRDYGGCPDHSSEAHERSSEPCIVFYASLRAHLNSIVAWFDGLSNWQQAGGYVWKILEERHTLYKFGIMYSIIRLACLLIRHYISAVNSLGVLCLPLCPDKLGTQVSLCSNCSKLGVIFFLDSTFVPWPRNSETGR